MTIKHLQISIEPFGPTYYSDDPVRVMRVVVRAENYRTFSYESCFHTDDFHSRFDEMLHVAKAEILKLIHVSPARDYPNLPGMSTEDLWKMFYAGVPLPEDKDFCKAILKEIGSRQFSGASVEQASGKPDGAPSAKPQGVS